MEIRIYRSPDTSRGQFEILGITEAASNVSYSCVFYSSGMFEFTIPWGAAYTDQMTPGSVVLIDKVFLGQIEASSKTADQSERVLRVSGGDILALTSRALCLPPEFDGLTGNLGLRMLEGSTESIVKMLWAENVTAPPQYWRPPAFGIELAPDGERGIANDAVTIAPDQTVSEVTMPLLERAGLGLVYTPDIPGGIVTIDVAVGVNRTAHQTENPPVVFSFDRRTLLKLSQDVSLLSSANVFLGGSGSFEDGLYAIAVPESASGWNRREQFLSLEAENPEDSAELFNQISAEKQAYKPGDSLSFGLNPAGFVIGQDFNVGDYVTVKDVPFGIEADVQIIALKTTATASGVTHSLEAGVPVRTAIGILKRMIQNGG